MPPIFSSPHPLIDPDVDWNPGPPSEPLMTGNPYPDVQGVPPNYDAHLWRAEAEEAEFQLARDAIHPTSAPVPHHPLYHPHPPMTHQDPRGYYPPQPMYSAGPPYAWPSQYFNEQLEHPHRNSRPFRPPAPPRGRWNPMDDPGSESDEDPWAHEGGVHISSGRRHESDPPPLMDRSPSPDEYTMSLPYRPPKRHYSPSNSPPPLGGPGIQERHVKGARVKGLPAGVYPHEPPFSPGGLDIAQPLQYGEALPAAALRRSESGTKSIKKAMRWLSRPISSPFTSATLHPLLRSPTLLRQVSLHWDVVRPPLPTRGGVAIGVSGGFSEPSTAPPTTYMRLLIPIPGIDHAHWPVNVFPIEFPHQTLPPPPGSPYAHGSPFSGGSSFSSSFPFNIAPPVPVVTNAAVLLALHAAVQRRATEQEFLALPEQRRSRVAAAFWARCRRSGGEAEADGQVRYGVRRLDFLGQKTRWEGLSPTEEMEGWIVRLGQS